MIKRLLAGALCAACLSGCAQTSAVTDQGISAAATITPTLAQAAGTLATAVKATLSPKAQASVAKYTRLCADFTPDAQSLAAIAATFKPGVTTTIAKATAAIGGSICQALAAAPAGNGLGLLDRGEAPAVNGILIHGKFSDGRKI